MSLVTLNLLQLEGICNGDSGGPLMRIDIETGETQILGIVSMVVKKGCTTVIPAVFVRVSKYVDFIKRNLENFVDPHVDIHKQPTLVCLIAEQ